MEENLKSMSLHARDCDYIKNGVHITSDNGSVNKEEIPLSEYYEIEWKEEIKLITQKSLVFEQLVWAHGFRRVITTAPKQKITLSAIEAKNNGKDFEIRKIEFFNPIFRIEKDYDCSSPCSTHTEKLQYPYEVFQETKKINLLRKPFSSWENDEYYIYQTHEKKIVCIIGGSVEHYIIIIGETKQEILNLLCLLLTKKPEPNKFYIFYGGHRIIEENTNREEIKKKYPCLSRIENFYHFYEESCLDYLHR